MINLVLSPFDAVAATWPPPPPPMTLEGRGQLVDPARLKVTSSASLISALPPPSVD